jgi:hypothetical protein
MKKTTAAIMTVAALLTGCATPTTGPTGTPTQGAVEAAATPVPSAQAPAFTPWHPLEFTPFSNG